MAGQVGLVWFCLEGSKSNTITYLIFVIFSPQRQLVTNIRYGKDAKDGKVVCDQVPEGENHTLLARREELNTTMMEQGCTRDMDKWGTVWSQVSRQENN